MNEETKTIMVVGEVREALNHMSEVLRVEGITLVISDNAALERWHELQKQYDDFYKLSVPERLEKSGMASKAGEEAYGR